MSGSTRGVGVRVNSRRSRAWVGVVSKMMTRVPSGVMPVANCGLRAVGQSRGGPGAIGRLNVEIRTPERVELKTSRLLSDVQRGA